MGRFEKIAIIDAPIERVFDYRLDVSNLPAYNPDVSELRALFEGAPEVGSAYEFRVRIAPLFRAKCRLTIARIERPHVLEFEMQSLMRAREICTFERVEGGKTRLRFETEVDTPGGPFARLIDAIFVEPIGRSQVSREVDAIAGICRKR
jgi:uncharacterized protein YndB with AHSA1/START domain